MRVSISSEVVPEIREFERTSTTITNVYVQDRVEKYLRELQARLGRIGFKGSLFMMISSGGIGTIDTAIRFPVRLLESRPAAGGLASARPAAARWGTERPPLATGGGACQTLFRRPRRS